VAPAPIRYLWWCPAIEVGRTHSEGWLAPRRFRQALPSQFVDTPLSLAGSAVMEQASAEESIRFDALEPARCRPAQAIDAQPAEPHPARASAPGLDLGASFGG